MTSPARFASKKLNDVTAEEGSRACFEAELTHLGGNVQWFVDDELIEPTSKYELIASGLSRALVVTECQLELNQVKFFTI